jgi:hypothetical protein
VWVQKYRFKVLKDKVAREVEKYIVTFSGKRAAR